MSLPEKCRMGLLSGGIPGNAGGTGRPPREVGMLYGPGGLYSKQLVLALDRIARLEGHSGQMRYVRVVELLNLRLKQIFAACPSCAAKIDELSVAGMSAQSVSREVRRLKITIKENSV